MCDRVSYTPVCPGLSELLIILHLLASAGAIGMHHSSDFFEVLGSEPRASYMLGKQNQVTSIPSAWFFIGGGE